MGVKVDLLHASVTRSAKKSSFPYCIDKAHVTITNVQYYHPPLSHVTITNVQYYRPPLSHVTIINVQYYHP